MPQDEDIILHHIKGIVTTGHNGWCNSRKQVAIQLLFHLIWCQCVGRGMQP